MLKYISSKTQESVEATISEYRRESDKFSLRRLAQKQQRSKMQGLLSGSHLTTPSRLRSSRSSRHPLGSSSHQWRRLAPGIRHLVATNGYGGKEGAKQPWVLIQSTRKTYIRSKLSMHLYQRNGLYLWTKLQNARREGKSLAYQRLASCSNRRE